MATQATALLEFAERIRRVAYGNPVYYGIERAAGRPCKTTDAVDRQTRERCRHFHLSEPASIRVSFLRLPMGDSLTLEFLDASSMAHCTPVQWMVDELVRVVFAGGKPERTEQNQPWAYWLVAGRPEDPLPAMERA